MNELMNDRMIYQYKKEKGIKGLNNTPIEKLMDG